MDDLADDGNHLDALRAFNRRAFLWGSAAVASSVAAGGFNPGSASATTDGAHWLGREWWGNRLQDWILRNGRMECVAEPGFREGRTISHLTSEIVAPKAVLRVRTGTLRKGAGFSGFLIGTGVPGEDWRTRVLVGRSSGTGGGIMATYEADGTVRFRDHTSETDAFAYTELASRRRRAPRRRGGRRGRRLNEDVVLELEITPRPGGKALLTLKAYDRKTRTLLAVARKGNVSAAAVRGGVGLISSDRRGSGARFWFRGFSISGRGVRRSPRRGLGPVVGTLFTVSGGVLRMSAQLMPVNVATTRSASLEVLTGASWRRVATVPIGPGFVAAFQVGWDNSSAKEYRVVVGGHPLDPFPGVVPAEPRGRPLVMGSISCTKASHRRTDDSDVSVPLMPGESSLGRYTQKNVYFPFDKLASGLEARGIDMLVAHGDQYYETHPTAAAPGASPELDFLGRYLLWLWSFRDVTRSRPTVVLVDDHDVYHANVWGAGGVTAPGGNQANGGYVRSAEWVNIVQRVQCGHNPAPFDPTPVAQGIGVYYGSFSYGGVSFAILEDRKFKSPPRAGVAPQDLSLLGQRQEQFLSAWTNQHPGQPKVVLTQTSLASVQTNVSGTPMTDYDSNGWPKAGRDRAVELIGAAKALVVAGDQHLGSLVRHGLPAAPEPPQPSPTEPTPTEPSPTVPSPTEPTPTEPTPTEPTPTEPSPTVPSPTEPTPTQPPPTEPPAPRPITGPFQFIPPAGGSSFQRWFEPGDLPGSHGRPHTGRWTDAFGNEVDVIAVVQPKVSRAAFNAYYPGSLLGDRNLKQEGYGVVRIDTRANRFVLECWRWDTDPRAAGAQQFPGFPHVIPFSEL